MVFEAFEVILWGIVLHLIFIIRLNISIHLISTSKIMKLWPRKFSDIQNITQLINPGTRLKFRCTYIRCCCPQVISFIAWRKIFEQENKRVPFNFVPARFLVLRQYPNLSKVILWVWKCFRCQIKYFLWTHCHLLFCFFFNQQPLEFADSLTFVCSSMHLLRITNQF